MTFDPDHAGVAKLLRYYAAKGERDFKQVGPNVSLHVQQQLPTLLKMGDAGIKWMSDFGKQQVASDAFFARPSRKITNVAQQRFSFPNGSPKSTAPKSSSCQSCFS